MKIMGEAKSETPATNPGWTGMEQQPVVQDETNPDMKVDEVVFLEPGQAGAQNIVKAISHQNAGDVLSMLSTFGPMRLSDIAEKQGISINAAKYHVDQLLHAGLIEIANTRYSVKGRKVKIYRLKNQIFVIAPKTKQKDFLSAVLKSTSALGLFILVFAVTILQPFVALPTTSLHLAGSIEPGTIPAPAFTDEGVIPALIIASIITVIVLVIYQMYRGWWDNRSLFEM